MLWLAAALKAHAWWASRTFTNGTFAVSTTAIALACTWKVTSSAATGPSTQGDLPEHMLLVVAALATQLLLQSLRSGRPAARAIALRAVSAGVVLAIMGTTYALAPSEAAEAVYRVAFHGYLSVALVESLRLVIRYSRTFDDTGRRMNLVLIGWGSAVGLIYSASRLLYVLVDVTITPAPTVIHTAGSAAALIGSAGIALGILAPRSIRAAQRWSAATGSIRRTHSLWRDLVAAFPDVALPTKPPITVHRAELRDRRRLLEIAEGLARARVTDPDPPDGRDRLGSLARVLHGSRPSWTDRGGSTAAELLPTAASAAEERRVLHELADRYRTTAHHSSAPTSGEVTT